MTTYPVPSPPPWQAPPARDVLVGDAEREGACRRLCEHFEAGRLTHDELDERLNLAMGARTAGDLRRLTADLPQQAWFAPPASAVVAPPQHPLSPVGTVLEVMLACIAAMALTCTLLLLSVSGHESIVAALGVLGGGTVVGTVVHFAHRLRQTRPNLPPRTDTTST